MTDWGALYRDNVEAVSALALGLDDERLAVMVPATPAWSVRDVLGHLAGGPADVVSGRMDGAPGPEWTARHVGERMGLEVPTLVSEMRDNVGGVVHTLLDNPRPAVVWDVAVHHADLHEALDLGAPPERFWMPVAEMVGPMFAPSLVGEVAPYELFRGIFSRRSRTQLAAWPGGLSGEELDALGVFGPRDDEQPVPA